MFGLVFIAEFVSYQQEQLEAAETGLEALRMQAAKASATTPIVAELQNQLKEYEDKLRQGGTAYH